MYTFVFFNVVIKHFDNTKDIVIVTSKNVEQ